MPHYQMVVWDRHYLCFHSLMTDRDEMHLLLGTSKVVMKAKGRKRLASNKGCYTRPRWPVGIVICDLAGSRDSGWFVLCDG